MVGVRAPERPSEGALFRGIGGSFAFFEGGASIADAEEWSTADELADAAGIGWESSSDRPRLEEAPPLLKEPRFNVAVPDSPFLPLLFVTMSPLLAFALPFVLLPDLDFDHGPSSSAMNEPSDASSSTSTRASSSSSTPKSEPESDLPMRLVRLVGAVEGNVAAVSPSVISISSSIIGDTIDGFLGARRLLVEGRSGGGERNILSCLEGDCGEGMESLLSYSEPIAAAAARAEGLEILFDFFSGAREGAELVTGSAMSNSSASRSTSTSSS